MKIQFAKGNHADANGQVALAIVACLLDVLVYKTQTLTAGQANLILDQATRSLPKSPVAIDEEANVSITELRKHFKAKS